MAHVCISLGSNLGDRERNLFDAYNRIISIKGIRLSKLSRFYETEPVGGPPQPKYLNAALSIETELSPYKLLELFQYIENSMGRIHNIKWGPRNIDIDILLYDNKIIDDDCLKIPHPLMHTRLFVLEPLSEIEPFIIHPILKKSILLLYKEINLSLTNTK